MRSVARATIDLRPVAIITAVHVPQTRNACSLLPLPQYKIEAVELDQATGNWGSIEVSFIALSFENAFFQCSS